LKASVPSSAARGGPLLDRKRPGGQRSEPDHIRRRRD